ncbi:DEAD/DEAH box helicase [Phycicoccus sp. Soil802]|uniref:DEAD/DEAH box helicase n=1 Tax=Phycicoccus sp. Soil802 TaxID=1736414 RepID=UPI000703642C|nr:DEAD/DEAH box helicase [Phycicoccus sp. Soil802]KRF22918.1 hypothetical protein ASG91_16220 [Phycicoccus sp. Soil802]
MTTFVGTLHPHQTEGLTFLRDQPRAILADQVGLGKTVQLAALIGHLADTGTLREPAPDPANEPPQRGVALPRLPVLWITTAGLVAQTEAELKRFLPSLGVTTSESGTIGNKADRERMEAFLAAHPSGPDVIVTNHDLANRRVDHLSALRPLLVVVDEASALKGAGARYEAAKALCDDAERVAAVTATPQENDPMELWAVMSLAGLPGTPDKEQFGQHVEWREFSDGTRKPVGWLTPENAGIVMRWLGARFLRRTAEQVGLPLPVRVDSGHRLVPLSTVQQKEYDKARWINHALVRHARMAKAARRGSDGSSSVVDAAVETIRELAERGEKVVVFAEHLEILGDLSTSLEAAEVGHVALKGENTKDERSDAVEVFRDDPATPVLIGTKVLEHGLNLQFSNVLVSVGQTYNPAREAQREGRLRRIGSPNATYRHLVFLPDTPQTRKQLETLERKAEQAAPVLAPGGVAA